MSDILIETSLTDVEAAFARGDAALVRASRPEDLNTPVAAMLKLGRDRKNAFLLESVEGGNFRGRYSIIGLEPDLAWRVVGSAVEIARTAADVAAGVFRAQPGDPLDSLRALRAESAIALPDGVPAPAAGLFGFLGYEMIGFVERLPEPKPDPVGAPDALLVRPTIVLVFDALSQELQLYSPVRPTDGDAETAFAAATKRLEAIAEELARPVPPPPNAAPIDEPAVEPQSSVAPAYYHDMVERTKTYIRAGDVFQAVPSQRHYRDFSLPPFALYRALRRLNPSPYLYFFNFADLAIVGSSPEILVRVQGKTVTVRPIAGTRPRGANDAEDRAIEAELLADPKERAEHLMLLDLGRNDVGRVAAPGAVTVTKQFEVERYSHVMHIVSNVVGELHEECDVVDALFAGFPAGTVSGAPKVRAMEIIHELETEKRGIYAGGVGYFSAGGDMDFCIALRTGVVKDQTLHVRAGGGVVYDSDPEYERLESCNKAAAVFRAAEQAGRFA